MSDVINFPKGKTKRVVSPDEIVHLMDDTGNIVAINRIALQKVLLGESTVTSLGETTLRLLLAPTLSQLLEQWQQETKDK